MGHGPRGDLLTFYPMGMRSRYDINSSLNIKCPHTYTQVNPGNWYMYTKDKKVFHKEVEVSLSI